MIRAGKGGTIDALIQPVVKAITAKRGQVPARRSVLVGLSGIDGCGKGYVAGLLVVELERAGLKTAAIHADGWLNLPPQRFDPRRPAEHFYEHAIRFPEMFAQLILPLQARRSVHVVADFAEETATAFRRHTYEFEDVDVIVLEGIYLFKQAYRPHFDLAIWVDCTWETALERALQRQQEGLPPAETVRAYRTIYFPAQEIHFTKDNPRSIADLVIINDARLTDKAAMSIAPASSSRSLCPSAIHRANLAGWNFAVIVPSMPSVRHGSRGFLPAGPVFSLSFTVLLNTIAGKGQWIGRGIRSRS